MPHHVAFYSEFLLVLIDHALHLHGHNYLQYNIQV